jgi:hypothetical protein
MSDGFVTFPDSGGDPETAPFATLVSELVPLPHEHRLCEKCKLPIWFSPKASSILTARATHGLSTQFLCLGCAAKLDPNSEVRVLTPEQAEAEAQDEAMDAGFESVHQHLAEQSLDIADQFAALNKRLDELQKAGTR